MRIVIETLPAEAMRYATAGDYFWESDGTLRIQVIDLPFPNMSFLIAIHELVEAKLTEIRKIPEPVIRAFDEAHPDHPDPGHHPDAPYRDEHIFAELVEQIIAREMGVDWQQYGDTLLCGS